MCILFDSVSVLFWLGVAGKYMFCYNVSFMFYCVMVRAHREVFSFQAVIL